MEDVITLDYGSGGQKTAELIDSLLVPAFSNPALNDLGDGAVLEGNGQLVFSTDSFVVSPWKFPGGNIGGFGHSPRCRCPGREDGEGFTMPGAVTQDVAD